MLVGYSEKHNKDTTLMNTKKQFEMNAFVINIWNGTIYVFCKQRTTTCEWMTFDINTVIITGFVFANNMYCFGDFFNHTVIQILCGMLTLLLYNTYTNQSNTTLTIHTIPFYQLYYNLQSNFCTQNIYHFLQSNCVACNRLIST